MISKQIQKKRRKELEIDIICQIEKYINPKQTRIMNKTKIK